MKRPPSNSHNNCESNMKKMKVETGFVDLDDNLIFEIFKHVDAKTLGMAACVSKQWHKTAEDERLWEMICTGKWSNVGCGNKQLRSVVLALGGFRRLHSLNPASASAPFTPMIHWGKDEVHLYLSLLSIRYYEKMNFKNTDL